MPRLRDALASAAVAALILTGLGGLAWSIRPAPSQAVPGSLPDPVVSGTPWKPASWRPTAPSAALPSGPAPRGGGSRYCPPSDGGRIEWPAADDAWFANTIRGDGPGQGPAVPFTATQVVICRYGLAGTLVGAGVVTDAAAVRRMQDTVNAATHVESSAECRIEEGTYVFFTAGTRAAFFTFDLTGCDAWMMPQGVVLPASFARDLRRFS